MKWLRKRIVTSMYVVARSAMCTTRQQIEKCDRIVMHGNPRICGTAPDARLRLLKEIRKSVANDATGISCENERKSKPPVDYVKSVHNASKLKSWPSSGKPGFRLSGWGVVHYLAFGPGVRTAG